MGDKKLAFARRQILQQSSTLIVHLYFSSTLSFCTFLKKYQKQGSRVRHSVLKVDNIAFSHPVRCKLRLHCARLNAVNVVDLQSKFKSRFATSFSRCTPRRSLLVAMLGAARTRFAQTSCHLFPSIARLLTVPPNAALPPLAGNYLCEEDSLTYPMHCSAYNGNIFKPAPSKSQRTAGQAEEIGQNLFERCIYAMLLLREKRVVLSPMLERTAVCGTIAGEQCLRRREL